LLDFETSVGARVVVDERSVTVLIAIITRGFLNSTSLSARATISFDHALPADTLINISCGEIA
jgi:hypothetical protein